MKKEWIIWTLVTMFISVVSWNAGERQTEAKYEPILAAFHKTATSSGATLAAVMHEANTSRQPCKPDYRYNPVTQKVEPLISPVEYRCAKKVKAAYPQVYDDLSDMELAQRTLAKYPDCAVGPWLKFGLTDAPSPSPATASK